MKIIHKPATDWTYKHTCKFCDTELEVEKSDVKYSFQSGYGRDSDYDYWSAKCPVCNESFSIPAAKIPKIVQIEIKKK